MHWRRTYAIVYMRSRQEISSPKKAAFSNSRTALNIVAVRFVLEKKIRYFGWNRKRSVA